MKVIERDIWLCDDCMILTETGDATGFDYHYEPEEAAKRLKACEDGLNRLGPNLVNDNTENDGDQYECRECGHIGMAEDFEEVEVDDEMERLCPQCGSDFTTERDCGREEFSRRGCDCCDSTLAGSRSRYAILGE